MYKSMALCALGQQGKGVELKTLINLGDIGKCVCFSVFDLASGGMRRGTLPASKSVVGRSVDVPWTVCWLSVAVLTSDEQVLLFKETR